MTMLYHCAPACVSDSIDTEGLRATFGEVYAAGAIEHALTFMAFRLIDHVHGTREVEMDGKTYTIPNLVHHDELHVWVIDKDATDQSNWADGNDHSASFFGDATSYVHKGPIPRAALVGKIVIKESDLIYA